MKEVPAPQGLKRIDSFISHINNPKRVNEIRRLGIRFSPDSHVAEIRKAFGIPPKSPKQT